MLDGFPPEPMAPFTLESKLPLAGALAVLLALAVQGTSVTGQAAATPPPQTFGDQDGDGLDDLLEVRLGTRLDAVDTDGDGATDLEEILAGGDPLTPGAVEVPRDARMHAEAYATGSSIVVQLFALHRNPARRLTAEWATTRRQGLLPYAELMDSMLGSATLSSPNTPGVQIEVLRFVLSRSLIENLGGLALLFRADLGESKPYYAPLSLALVAGELVQVQISISAGGQGGGVLLPLDPPGASEENLENSACAYFSIPTGQQLGAFTVLQYTSSQCVYSAGTYCPVSGCSSLAGEEFVAPIPR